MPAEQKEFLDRDPRQQLVLEVLNDFGRARLRVTGTSMLPALLPYDVVTLTRFRREELAIGEIVAFQRTSRIFVHRVVGIQGDQVLTRGDAHIQLDPPITRDEILGRLETVERFGHALADVPAMKAFTRSFVIGKHSSIFTFLFSVYARIRSTAGTIEKFCTSLH